jgi:hypothetical protein
MCVQVDMVELQLLTTRGHVQGAPEELPVATDAIGRPSALLPLTIARIDDPMSNGLNVLPPNIAPTLKTVTVPLQTTATDLYHPVFVDFLSKADTDSPSKNVATAPPEAGAKSGTDTTSKSGTWYPRCEYQCRICNQMFYHSKLLICHVKKAHGKAYYIDRFGPYETLSVYHNCHLCGRKVKQNYTSVYSHLWHWHKNIDAVEYGTMYCLGSGDSATSSERNSDSVPKQVVPAFFSHDKSESIHQNTSDPTNYTEKCLKMSESKLATGDDVPGTVDKLTSFVDNTASEQKQVVSVLFSQVNSESNQKKISDLTNNMDDIKWQKDKLATVTGSDVPGTEDNAMHTSAENSALVQKQVVLVSFSQDKSESKQTNIYDPKCQKIDINCQKGKLPLGDDVQGIKDKTTSSDQNSFGSNTTSKSSTWYLGCEYQCKICN